mmetsp:Transcript_38366/g.121202  ORF Transcript_38366/g.121202 Transcript_38366/m.121202 type:complete len:278 (+) Transcript_38366:1071-1904(+)
MAELRSLVLACPGGGVRKVNPPPPGHHGQRHGAALAAQAADQPGRELLQHHGHRDGGRSKHPLPGDPAPGRLQDGDGRGHRAGVLPPALAQGAEHSGHRAADRGRSHQRQHQLPGEAGGALLRVEPQRDERGGYGGPPRAQEHEVPRRLLHRQGGRHMARAAGGGQDVVADISDSDQHPPPPPGGAPPAHHGRPATGGAAAGVRSGDGVPSAPPLPRLPQPQREPRHGHRAGGAQGGHAQPDPPQPGGLREGHEPGDQGGGLAARARGPQPLARPPL